MMWFGFSIVGRALVFLVVSFIGIAFFRVLEEQARKIEFGLMSWLGVVFCNMGKVLSVIGAIVLVLWSQIVRFLEQL